MSRTTRSGVNAIDSVPVIRRRSVDTEKASRADFVYVNDGSLDDLDEFVSDVVEVVCAR